MSETEARAALKECCASSAWVKMMMSHRPFLDPEELQRAAEEFWWVLKEEDWREAFASHPQIGSRGELSPRSQQEQSGMLNAAEATKSAIEEGNRAYFRKFGYIYIVCATGKSAEEMLDSLSARLKNDPGTEIRVAAAEQSKITRLRLRKMLSD